MIHVTQALHELHGAEAGLDEQARRRLAAVGGARRAAEVLRRFPWLPRQVHEVGALHFRGDAPVFEEVVGEVDSELGRAEEELVCARAVVYR